MKKNIKFELENRVIEIDFRAKSLTIVSTIETEDLTDKKNKIWTTKKVKEVINFEYINNTADHWDLQLKIIDDKIAAKQKKIEEIKSIIESPKYKRFLEYQKTYADQNTRDKLLKEMQTEVKGREHSAKNQKLWNEIKKKIEG